MAPTVGRQLSYGRRIGYATGIYGVFLAWMMVGLYLMYFYTDVMGLTPGQAGLVFFIASMWDAVTDPVMGWLIEKTRTRWGKYRPYLLLAAIPFAASFAALTREAWSAEMMVEAWYSRPTRSAITSLTPS